LHRKSLVDEDRTSWRFIFREELYRMIPPTIKSRSSSDAWLVAAASTSLFEPGRRSSGQSAPDSQQGGAVGIRRRPIETRAACRRLTSDVLFRLRLTGKSASAGAGSNLDY